MTNTPIGGSLPEPSDVPLADDPEEVVLFASDGWALRAAKRILANTTLVKGSETRMASIILHEFSKHQRSLQGRLLPQQEYPLLSREEWSKAISNLQSPYRDPRDTKEAD